LQLSECIANAEKMAPLLHDHGLETEAHPTTPETEARPASWWGSWLEVDATRQLEHGGRTIRQRRSTLDGERRSSRPDGNWQITRFSSSQASAPAEQEGKDSLVLSAWLCPRQLEATSRHASRRHSGHPVTAPSRPRSSLVKPALKRSSVSSEGSTRRRVSFSDTTDTREVEAAREEKLAQPESGVKPADEAFAAFRVKAQFEENELPPSLRAHGNPRYHALGHHHHASATMSPSPVIDEGIPSTTGITYVPVRTRVSEVQGPRGISVRKLPHYKIRIRRAFSRAKMLHPHHHMHHSHNGPIVLGEAPVPAPMIVHIRAPDVVATPIAASSPLPEPPPTPLTAAALQRHEALMQQSPVDSSPDAMAMAGVPASLSLGMSMHQGAIFGVVSTVAVEAMQLSLAQKRGSAVDQTATFASAAARGAAMGAAGGGMALLLGPVAPTAIFVGYGLVREWSAQGYAWLQNETSGPLALSRALEVSGSAAGGVACAMAAATLLSGFSGMVVAAAAGCSGFAGSLGGREVAAVCFQRLSDDVSTMPKRCKSRSSKSSKSSRRRNSSIQVVPLEPHLLEAYSVLGVDPSCSNAELKRAYRQAVLRSQSEDTDGLQTRFNEVIRAMERIRSTRRTPLQLDLVPDIWFEPTQTTQVDRHLFAGFIGGMSAQQVAISAI